VLELVADARPLDAQLSLSVEPADAAIAIDGQPRAAGVFRGPLAPGEHDVTVTRDGYRPHAETIALEPGGSAERTIVLEKERRASIFGAWWFWTAVGAAALAGGAVAVWAASGPPPYDGGTVGRTVEALRF
jgi:hypothetical protein